MHSGAFVHAVFVVYIPQFVVTVQVVAVQPQPVCAVHAGIIVYVAHVVAVPAQRSDPSPPGFASAPPSRTVAHEIVAPGARQNPSPSHVKPPGQSCGPSHLETRQSSNAAPYVQPLVTSASPSSMTSF